MVRVTMMLSEEDLENMHQALGVAFGALRHFPDREIANRAQRRVRALHDALTTAKLDKIEDA
jgi:hypothetical protein